MDVLEMRLECQCERKIRPVSKDPNIGVMLAVLSSPIRDKIPVSSPE